MSIIQVLGQLAGRPDLLAWRPNGKFFRVTDRMSIEQPWPDRTRKAIFTYSDLVTDDWQVGDQEKMRKMFPANVAA
jgi:hypothetical protein